MLKTKLERRHFAWEATAAAACFISCLAAGLIGTLLTTGWILDAHLHPSLRNFGLILLILVFPLLILGGHCLDLLDRNRKSSEREGRGLHNRPLHVVALAFLLLLFIGSSDGKAQQPDVRPAVREQTDTVASPSPPNVVSAQRDEPHATKNAAVNTESSLIRRDSWPTSSIARKPSSIRFCGQLGD